MLTQKIRAKKTLPRHLTCHLFRNNLRQVWIVIVTFCFNFYTISMCERTISLTRTRRLYKLMEFPNAENYKHTWMMHMLYFDTSICWTIARSFCHPSLHERFCMSILNPNAVEIRFIAFVVLWLFFQKTIPAAKAMWHVLEIIWSFLLNK